MNFVTAKFPSEFDAKSFKVPSYVYEVTALMLYKISAKYL